MCYTLPIPVISSKNMAEPTYQEALKHSWRLTKSHHNLWPFGLFAVMLGQFGLFELVSRLWTASTMPTLAEWWQALGYLFSKQSWQAFQAVFTDGTAQWIWAFWLALTLIGIGITFLFVATVCQGALVYASEKYAAFRLRLPNERTAWHVGVMHFWRVLALNIMRKVVVAASAMIAVSALATISVSSAHLTWFWVAFFLALTIGLIASIMLVYAIAYVVVKEYSFWKSIRAAALLLWRHPLVSLETGLITLVLNGLLLVFTLFAVLYAFVLPSVLGTHLLNWLPIPILGSIIMVLSYSLFLALIMFTGAVFTVWTTSIWTYLFAKMDQGVMTSSLVRLFKR